MQQKRAWQKKKGFSVSYLGSGSEMVPPPGGARVALLLVVLAGVVGGGAEEEEEEGAAVAATIEDEVNGMRRPTTVSLLSPPLANVHVGGILTAVCAVADHVEPPDRVDWTHNGTVVLQDPPR